MAESGTYQFREVWVTLDTNPKLAIPGDPNRVSLTVSSSVSGAFQMSTKKIGMTATGLNVPTGVAPVVITRHTHGTLPQSEWWISGGLMQVITYIEILYLPDGLT